MSPFQALIKRGFDIAVSIMGLLLLSPLIFFISLAITLDSRGPILYRYGRYGANNAIVEVYGFRWTFSGQENNPSIELPHRSLRVTRFGHILRRSGVDKLPQLVNVLRGEMSIIGPHPFLSAPGKAFPLEQTQNVKPGLVSWAQLYDDYDPRRDIIDRRIEYDRYYLDNRSFLLDMKILLRALLSKRTYL